MPHIPFGPAKFINTDMIVTVHRYENGDVDVSTIHNVQALRGKSAETFMQHYHALCVAQQRPEVG